MTRLERLEMGIEGWQSLGHHDAYWALAMLREAEQEWKCEESIDTLPCSARAFPCSACIWKAKLREEV